MFYVVELDLRLSWFLWLILLTLLAVVMTLPQQGFILIFVISAIIRLIFSFGIELTLILLGTLNVRKFCFLWLVKVLKLSNNILDSFIKSRLFKYLIYSIYYVCKANKSNSEVRFIGFADILTEWLNDCSLGIKNNNNFNTYRMISHTSVAISVIFCIIRWIIHLKVDFAR